MENFVFVSTPNQWRKSIMPETTKNKSWIYVRWFLLRAILVVYDFLAVNMAHYLALVIRFYVAKEFHSVAAHYFDAFNQYALWYTVFCLAVFCFFRLYSGIWKFAGFNDLNRILFASGICFVAHVGGTLLFSMRMPITFYCIGAALQFCLIAASRFSYRLFLLEKDKVFSNRNADVYAMVVGTGSRAKMALRELDRESGIRPMCVLNYINTRMGSLFDGIPVVDGLDQLKSAVEKYRINYVVIASVSMPQETRNRIMELCKEMHVEAQDYSGFFESTGSHISFRNLTECMEGPVEVVLHGKHQRYADAQQAQRNLVGRYMVKSVRSGGDAIVVELDDYCVVQNDLSADWVKDQEMETGEAISFF